MGCYVVKSRWNTVGFIGLLLEMHQHCCRVVEGGWLGGGWRLLQGRKTEKRNLNFSFISFLFIFQKMNIVNDPINKGESLKSFLKPNPILNRLMKKIT